ncbi:HFR106Cp [Eremothecium sinecaudum]|uniref:HFR106Cp n=1 Tax=Eremothecium sinecaudum TaxID=45286 RepID=A0A109UZX7_9SACH|nr:HFR106Cp [Eremothecium sinecaudum]AMD21961.1 HFR106Cp [Eremothecium sinecaudum]
MSDEQNANKVSDRNPQKDLSNEDDAYNAIFNGEFGALEIGTYVSSQGHDGETEHLPDAIDFEDEDELADEELPEEQEAIGRDAGPDGGNDDYLTIMDDAGGIDYQGNNALFMGVHDDNSNGFVNEHGEYNEFSDEQQRELEHQKQQEQERIAQEEQMLVRSYFPHLRGGKVLKLTKIVPKPIAEYQWQRNLYLSNRVLKPLIPLKIRFEVQQDTRRMFKAKGKTWQTSSTYLKKKKKKGIVHISIDEIYPLHEEKTDKTDSGDVIPEDLLVVADEWDYKNMIGEVEPESRPSRELSVSTPLFDNKVFDDPRDWDWDESDLLEGKLTNLRYPLDMNDERLLFSKRVDSNSRAQPLVFNEKQLISKFNISNDDKYKILKENYQTKIRSTISNLSIEHSQPATRLQSPFYKVLLPRDQLRHFHRSHFGHSIRPGTNIVFSKIKVRKRKRDKGKDVKEIYAHSSDLTVGDSVPVFLMEYCEQQPVALSKFGMSSKLINYYRKRSELDTSRPKLSVGETHVLGVQDKSPFWNFGFVEPGTIIPTLYNNMIRAPVFKHEVSRTDFLIVKSTGNSCGTRFYLRHINHLFTVGQTYPVVEIPGPNSRKVTSMGKNRLRMVVYRILNKSPEHRLLVKQVARHFPDQNDMQNRQRLKEFMKYQRDGDDQGFWKLKEGEVLLDNENVKKMISPEDVSLIESMYAGQQFQDDTDMYNFNAKLRNLEENLIPWVATKNFLNATQMRAMIQIHGAGDPTGCGEGFSFLKTSMKGGFTKSGEGEQQPQVTGGHSYNVAQQQKAYEEEISKTWYKQAKSLGIQNPFEELDDPDVVNKTNKRVLARRDDDKVLKIVRKTRDKNGIIQRQTAVVRDPRVIHAYLRIYEKRREEAERNLGLEELMNDNIDLVTGENDEERQLKQKKLLEEQLAKLEKSKERRQARKAAKEKSKDGKVGKVKNTPRRCATCGAIGHIRTNKSCPMYNGGVAANANANASSALSGSATPSNIANSSNSVSATLQPPSFEP